MVSGKLSCLTGVIQWAECHPADQEVIGWVPRLQAQSPVEGMPEATNQCFPLTSMFSPSLSPSFALSQKIFEKI